jgi:hypothetical protein
LPCQGARYDLPYPTPGLPEFLGRVVTAVIEHQGVAMMSDVQAWQVSRSLGHGHHSLDAQ